MDHLTIFIAVTSAAVVIQAGILFGMFLSLRKTSVKVEALAEEVRTKILPTADLVQNLLTDLRPKIDTAVTNISESTTMVRHQLARLDATVSDVVDRARLQVIRTDDLVSRTLDRVEETTDMMHQTIVSPVQKLAGLVQGVTAGLEFLIGSRRRRERSTVPQDEMFI